MFFLNGGGKMILNATGKIAVKCSECGKYSIIDINEFKLKTQTGYYCECGHKILNASASRGELVLDIGCIACDSVHNYRFKLRNVMKQSINIISCPVTGMEIAFLGKDHQVNDFVKRYMDDMFELLKSLGIIQERASWL
jgi:DNA-directed RNA polymerase subunit RPC12/RpoP